MIFSVVLLSLMKGWEWLWILNNKVYLVISNVIDSYCYICVMYAQHMITCISGWDYTMTPFVRLLPSDIIIVWHELSKYLLNKDITFFFSTEELKSQYMNSASTMYRLPDKRNDHVVLPLTSSR